MSLALENIEAASSRAPPNRLPMVNRPDASEEIKSLPARDATMVFIALQSSSEEVIRGEEEEGRTQTRPVRDQQ